MKKRIMTLVLAIVLTFGTCVSAMAGEEATKVVFVSFSGDYNGVKVEIPKTAVTIKADETLTEACDSVLKNSGLEYTMAYGYPSVIAGLGTADMGEKGWFYWSVYVNGGYTSTTAVNNLDEISCIYVTDQNATQMETKDFVDDKTLNPDASAQAEKLEMLKKAEKILANHIYSTIFKNGEYVPGVDNADDLAALYYVYSLKKAGCELDDFYNATYAKMEEQLKNGVKLANSNDYVKAVLLATVLGHDATDVGGVNLIDGLTSREVMNNSSYYLRESSVLLALTSGKYESIADDAHISESELVEAVLSQVDSAIESSTSWGVDMAAMTIQPLYRYYGKDEAVTAAVDKTLNFLGKMQSSEGYFGDSWTKNNAWSTAQTMMTMNAFNVNALSEDKFDFVKNGKTTVDAMLEFFDLDKETVDTASINFDPAQILRGISAIVGQESGAKKNIFDCEIEKKEESPQTPEKTPDENEVTDPVVSSPNTGDSNELVVYAIVMLLAGCVLANKGNILARNKFTN